jgi:leucyl aminopeptidase (aminopeptidase T)
MKLSGNINEPFLLFDPKIVQSGNIENYLIRISNGEVVTISNSIQNEKFHRLFSTDENQ